MAATYKVTAITKTIYQQPGGPNGPGYEVAFSTIPDNIAGSVTLPAATFTPEEVDKAATTAAATLVAVMHL